MMTLSFPEWVPLWGQLLVLAVGIVFGLAFMMMPFAVFGVKGRLAELSLQLEELQAELRARAMQGNRVPEGYAGHGAEPPLPFTRRAESESRPVVEEVRPPAVEKPATPRGVPVFAELRAPRVSDAYEARQEAPPAPSMESDPYKSAPVRRMPWHEEEDEQPEKSAEAQRRQKAPDANQEAYRPDFSREGGQPRSGTTSGRYDDYMGRAEPVLHFPSRNKP
ncbi:MAG: hypothetical protein LKH76_04370 [Acetobacter fabarum]|jgi:hypothetical protein|uniref:Uncharacterized protein n=1 Tax=Acetobacter fabarum TaxID=483199 RepID=A0A269Y031_9PROT|nr:MULTISPECIES: hypothetical protein [Acetobacter]MCH4026141.1 hypothetical protein [Acetobacter fabarum]MCH4054890.1 hypothetical protein [Acetobacter fabarum]MCH4085997.1 hypothetical protein [Acetobacter fabarum]MCH4127411.1 hypothetical protein [Acetobacter fabarum]MCH4136760.1 hypothetical protein [Acetobacter fabarum]